MKSEAPAARFRVVGKFALRSRKLFVVFGDLESGAIVPGMQLHITCNSKLGITATIASIENVLREGRDYVALCIQYEDENHLSVLEGLNIGNEVCDVRVA